jgi:hypothetical protein
VDTAARTKHKWGFVTALNDDDKFKLDMLKGSVKSFTNYSTAAPVAAPATTAAPPPRAPPGAMGPPLTTTKPQDSTRWVVSPISLSRSLSLSLSLSLSFSHSVDVSAPPC